MEFVVTQGATFLLPELRQGLAADYLSASVINVNLRTQFRMLQGSPIGLGLSKLTY